MSLCFFGVLIVHYSVSFVCLRVFSLSPAYLLLQDMPANVAPGHHFGVAPLPEHFSQGNSAAEHHMAAMQDQHMGMPGPLPPVSPMHSPRAGQPMFPGHPDGALSAPQNEAQHIAAMQGGGPGSPHRSDLPAPPLGGTASDVLAHGLRAAEQRIASLRARAQEQHMSAMQAQEQRMAAADAEQQHMEAQAQHVMGEHQHMAAVDAENKHAVAMAAHAQNIAEAENLHKAALAVHEQQHMAAMHSPGSPLRDAAVDHHMAAMHGSPRAGSPMRLRPEGPPPAHGPLPGMSPRPLWSSWFA